MLGEPPGSPRPLPLVRFADKTLRAFPEGGRFAAAPPTRTHRRDLLKAFRYHSGRPSGPPLR